MEKSSAAVPCNLGRVTDVQNGSLHRRHYAGSFFPGKIYIRFYLCLSTPHFYCLHYWMSSVLLQNISIFLSFFFLLLFIVSGIVYLIIVYLLLSSFFNLSISLAGSDCVFFIGRPLSRDSSFVI